MTDRNEVIERVAKAFADNGHESVCDWDWCVDGVKAEYRADAALIVGKIEETHLLIRKPETVPDGLRDPKTMTLWDLAQAIAVNSDIATHFYAKREENDPSDENYRVACEHYQRRNDCVAEIRDREAAHVLVPRPETMSPLTRANLVIAALRETLQGEEFGRDVSIDTIVTAFMNALVREFASGTSETP